MDYVQTALFEHRFWLQVLGDHARFFYTSLAPKEEEEIRGAIYFMNRFDRLLEVAKMDDAASALPDINRRAYRYANKLRAYKLSILERHLVGRISISLPPTFLNHMLNEIDEYLRILQYLCAGQIPPCKTPCTTTYSGFKMPTDTLEPSRNKSIRHKNKPPPRARRFASSLKPTT